MIKEKFYNLLQELVHCEVLEVLEVQNYLKRLKDIEKHLEDCEKTNTINIDRLSARLNELERRYATLARSILNGGK